MTEMSSWELAEGVRINMGNVTKLNPALAQHPMFRIAMDQLDTLCEQLEKELNAE